MNTQQLLTNLALIFAFPLLLPAQLDWHTNHSGRSFRFEAFGTDQGLPHETVNALFQDSRGFIWMGTPAGLVRYDGYQFRTFPYQTVDSLTGEVRTIAISVNDIAETPDGDLWVGCIYDRPNKPVLLRWDRKTEQLKPYLFTAGHSLLQRTIAEVLVHDDQLWANTEDQLIRIPLAVGDGASVDDEVPEHQVITAGKKGLQHPYYWGIHRDVKGRLWLATNQGVYEWIPEPDTFRYHQLSIPADLDLPIDYSLDKLLDIEGGQLLAFPRQPNFTIRIDPEKGTHEVVPGLTKSSLFEAVRTPTGQIWAGARWGTGGVQIYDPAVGHWEGLNIQIDAIDFLPVVQVKSMLLDHSGSIWIGTDQGPLLKYEPHRNAFHWLRHEPDNDNSLSHDWVTGVRQDEQGHYWLATFGGGLNRWERSEGRFMHIRAQPGRPDESGPLADLLIGLEVAQNGKVWFGEGFSAGAYDPGSGSFDHYRESGVVWDAFEDNEGRLWLAKFGGGLRLYEPELDDFRAIGLPHPTRPGEVIHPAMSGIFQDSRGDLWLGSHSPQLSGFFRFDPETETFQTFDLPEAHSFAEDRQGNIWIGSKDGLYRYDPIGEQFERYGKMEGLPHEDIKSVILDDHGRLWLSAGNAVSCFDLARDSLQHYFVSDGLPNGTFNYDTYKNGAGELFFCGTFGLLYFHPDSLRRSTIPPKLVFTGIDLFGNPLTIAADGPLGESIALGPDIRLEHWQNDLTIHYAALHFKNPDKHRYRVQLDPYDENWREVGQQTLAAYTNLDPGAYTFWMQGTNSDGLWSEASITLNILIRAPWYWNWWSRIFYATILVGLVFAVYRFQLNRRLALAETRRLRELDEVKSRLYTNITHEFRTPLTVIQGTTEQIREHETEKEIIRRNSRQLLEMVNRLLDLSKLEAGKLELQLVQGDIITFLSYVTESFHSLALNQKINLNFYAGDAAVVMDYDPEKILQIMSNLISNALKFTPEYGKVTITAHRHAGEGGEELLVRVSDTGVGISPEQLPKIFDRFHQADNSTTRKAEGTGIGLALCRELIELMDGRIEVESEPGEGSCFSFYLPVRQEAPLAETTEELYLASVLPVPETEEERNRRSAEGNTSGTELPILLIVEDNRDVRQYLASCLREDYQLLFARNGREGIEVAREHIPDIIISDVMMPEVDGYELCHTVKQDERTSHIPIILLTAKADMESRIEGLEYGADAYLTKPFHQSELEVRLRKLIVLRRQLQARYSRPGFEQNRESHREDAFILKVRQLVLDHLDEAAFDVEALSDALHLHRSQLHRKLKALTGQSTTHFIRRVRLQEGYRLLEEGELNVSEVAYAVGFSDPSYFSKLFSKAYGRPPSAV